MLTRVEPGRAILAAITSFTLALALVLMAVPRAQADHVNPVTVSGNPTCGSLTQGGTEFKIEAADELQDVHPGMSQHTDGTLVVKLNIYETGDGWEFDWETNFGVDVIVVKGGPGANVYTYNPIATSDTGLHSPFNPNSGEWYGLSHISFCYFPENATTTTTTSTSSTTTTQPTTTSTQGTTTTTQGTTTTTQGTTTTTEGTTTTTESTTTTTTQPTTTTTGATTTTTEETTTTEPPEVAGTEVTAEEEPEVAGTEVLPFTGAETDILLGAAVAMAGLGVLFLVAARGREES